MKITLAERESELMQVLWEHGPSTVGEVQERLKDELAYTTVLTILQKLERKAYVRHEEEGRSHRFMSAISREAAQSPCAILPPGCSRGLRRCCSPR